VPRKLKTSSQSVAAKEWLSRAKASLPAEASDINNLLAATLEANIQYFHMREENKRRKPPSVAERKKVATTLRRAANFIEAETTYPASRSGYLWHTTDLLDAMLIAKSIFDPKEQMAAQSRSDPGEILARIEAAHRQIEATRLFLNLMSDLMRDRTQPPKKNRLATHFYDKFGLSPPHKVPPTRPFVASLLLIWRSATGTPVREMRIGNPEEAAGRGPLVQFMISASVPILEIHGPAARSLSPSALQKAAVELRDAAWKRSDEVVEVQATIKKLV
jgi:hypothetical protein